MFKIYALKLKDSSDIRYIGRTSESIDIRLRKHISNAKSAKTKNYRVNWILKNIINIEIITIEDNITTFEESCIKEIEYIKKYRDIFNLINLTNGGDGGCPGYKHTEDAKKKIGDMHRGKKISDENIERLRNRFISDETKRKLSEKAKINSKGEKNPMYGKKRSDTSELNRKRKGWKHSEETINKMKFDRMGEKNPNTKIKESQKIEILEMYKSGISSREIGSIFNVSKTTILRIIKTMKNSFNI